MIFYSICGFALVGLMLLMVFSGRYINSSKKRNPDNTPIYESVIEKNAVIADGGCCGRHLTCEKKMIAGSGTPRYFEDEELDMFKGKAGDSYTDPEIEEFRYVLYTLRQTEVSEWLECLASRSIELPNQLKEEAFALINS